MSDSADSIQAQLAALRQGFAEQLPQRLAAIEEACAAWRESGSAERLGEYHRLVHSLTGAGATFGFERISQLARALERYLKQLREEAVAPEAAQFAGAAALLDELRAEVVTLKPLERQAEPGAGSGAEPEPEPEPEPESEPPERVVAAAEPPLDDHHLVYLLADEALLASGIDVQLSHFGYRVESFTETDALQRAVALRRPALIVSDVDLPAGAGAGIEAVAAIQRQQADPIPVIFFAGQASFDSRLAAVRASAQACLPKPLSVESLVDVMDGLMVQDAREPFRVLVVDDQSDQAQNHALVLRQAGILVKVVTDSMRVFHILEEFAPELILMDMYMPHCSGLELAAVIRQQPDYVGVPIVFLSSETDRTVQLGAMQAGGDDFLTKPIKPAELIQSVLFRAERYRTLRSLMSRDGLTGLLNHIRVMESLEHEVARAERYGASLSFAMIDIDFFKRVNDTYGHAVGDRVIKSLARLLQQRLRKSDIIGRYGGEEFAVIMPETPLANAVRVMEDVCRLFGEIVHLAGDESFSVTLSCGVAATPPFATVKELHEGADKRLYRAKTGGRNRVSGGGL